MTGFYIQCNTGLEWVNVRQNHHNKTCTKSRGAVIFSTEYYKEIVMKHLDDENTSNKITSQIR